MGKRKTSSPRRSKGKRAKTANNRGRRSRSASSSEEEERGRSVAAVSDTECVRSVTGNSAGDGNAGSAKKTKNAPEKEKQQGNGKPAISVSSESEDESSEAELGEWWHLRSYSRLKSGVEHMKKKWNAPIYGFFKETPDIEYKDDRQAHVFHCAAKGCESVIRRFVDKDALTSNLIKHARKCWGEETVKTASLAKSAEEVRDKIVGSILKNGSITVIFERKAKANVTCSHRNFTKRETR
jgi:hypothetical protein